MKTCFKCDRRLPLSEFYRHRLMGDGHLGKCKDCTKMDVAFYRHLKWTQDPVWREKERRRGVEKATRQRARMRGTLKIRARTALMSAVARGKIKKPSVCEECHCIPAEPLHGHHADYAKPLEVEWLCRECHVNRHAPQRWRFSA